MQTAEASAATVAPPDFAGFLAGFADPEKKFSSSGGFDGLEDDVAMLSYENALRGLERVAAKAAEIADNSPAEAGQIPSWESSGKTKEKDSFDPVRPEPAPTASEVERKSASVTVRMSQAESEILRQRAAEAGITVSAYLRSCAFEVETLRAQVKETVAQLRAASSSPAAKAESPRTEMPTPDHPAKHSWWSRFTPPARQRAVTA
jgi:predicted DNA binding CopG/RHH family protein